MALRISIIMYHYIRDLKHSNYPKIKGLSVELFKEQLQYIMKYYKVITMGELIETVKSNKNKLPDNSLLLTFDDGYKDHFDFVFPILDELGIQGSFFPAAKAIQEHQVLDVNKIHFILASVKDKQKLVEGINCILDKFREEFSLKKNEYYFKKFAVVDRFADRFNTREEIFIKKILQKELPSKLRNIILNRLFNKYVSEDEESFSKELYMSIDQLKCMKRNGMYIGNHGFDHCWLNTLERGKQEEEIDLSLNFLGKIGCDTTSWVMSYPYGAYNDSLISILKGKGCKIGLTVNVEVANLNKDNVFILPRLDTNDLPKNKNAEPNEWTLKVLNSRRQ